MTLSRRGHQFAQHPQFLARPSPWLCNHVRETARCPASVLCNYIHVLCNYIPIGRAVVRARARPSAITEWVCEWLPGTRLYARPLSFVTTYQPWPVLPKNADALQHACSNVLVAPASALLQQFLSSSRLSWQALATAVQVHTRSLLSTCPHAARSGLHLCQQPRAVHTAVSQPGLCHRPHIESCSSTSPPAGALFGYSARPALQTPALLPQTASPIPFKLLFIALP